MASTVSEADIRQAIEQVNHPAIDHSLVDLGIVRKWEISGERVTLTFAFPFPNIPIKDMLIDSVRLPLQGLGAEVEVETTVMAEDELQKFLAMEQEAWKGGV